MEEMVQNMFINVAAMNPYWHKTIPCWGRLFFIGELNITLAFCLFIAFSIHPLSLYDSQVDPREIIMSKGKK